MGNKVVLCISVLVQKNKIRFVNGSIKALAFANPKFHIWQWYNDMVLSWILNIIHLKMKTIETSIDVSKTPCFVPLKSSDDCFDL